MEQIIISVSIGIAATLSFYILIQGKTNNQKSAKNDKKEKGDETVKKKSNTQFYLVVFIILGLKYLSVLNHAKYIKVNPKEPPSIEKVVHLS
jgi:hypothetical protein